MVIVILRVIRFMVMIIVIGFVIAMVRVVVVVIVIGRVIVRYCCAFYIVVAPMLRSHVCYCGCDGYVER